MQRRMLTKEDEGGDETEVRREDQDRINKFSRLHQREIALEEDLKSKGKEKEDLTDISTELELVDDDEKVPYKIGDSFVMMSLDDAKELLEKETERIEELVEGLEGKLGETREEMDGLKGDLYARFGRSINLET